MSFLRMTLPGGRVVEIRGIKPRAVIAAEKVVYVRNWSFILAKDGSMHSPIGFSREIGPDDVHRYAPYLEGMVALGVMKRAEYKAVMAASVEAQKRANDRERVETIRDQLEALGISMPKALDKTLAKVGAQ